MRRESFKALKLSVIDHRKADTRYVYNEVFVSQIYHHSEMRLSKEPVIMDVGANIGIYTIWAQRQYKPKAIYCYEASPLTFACLKDNVQRVAGGHSTDIYAINSAIARSDGQRLLLHQSTKASAISTLLEPTNVGWIGEAFKRHELETHMVTTSTVSTEMEKNQLTVVDILKIDVEGYFFEVLKGVKADDYPKIRNIVLEADYLPETGINADDVDDLLKSNGYRTDYMDRTKSNNLVIYAWRV